MYLYRWGVDLTAAYWTFRVCLIVWSMGSWGFPIGFSVTLMDHRAKVRWVVFSWAWRAVHLRRVFNPASKRMRTVKA